MAPLQGKGEMLEIAWAQFKECDHWDNVHILFVDFQAAYDSNNRKQVYRVLRNF